ncbi:hypothetical protein PsorP6_008427 [Peronosclerospora sorghi]|uniref:Uncharacterized protein n=1 Tax=Peronosclerospora sorghi TaxID=230839 RepID=A0ACC0WDY2_9STRA|nr:hypothetical protein PsorP6_008427 [Peronosclerospora sorghi]
MLHTRGRGTMRVEAPELSFREISERQLETFLLFNIKLPTTSTILVSPLDIQTGCRSKSEASFGLDVGYTVLATALIKGLSCVRQTTTLLSTL